MFLFASYSNYVLKFMISAQTHEKPSSLECGQRSVNSLRFILYPREWEFIAQVHKNVTFSPKSNLNIFQFHFVYTSHITNEFKVLECTKGVDRANSHAQFIGTKCLPTKCLPNVFKVIYLFTVNIDIVFNYQSLPELRVYPVKQWLCTGNWMNCYINRWSRISTRRDVRTCSNRRLEGLTKDENWE